MQLEYVEKQIVLEGTERQARQKLQEVRKQVPFRCHGDDAGGGGGDSDGGTNSDGGDE